MISGIELAPGVWALQNSDTEHNTAVLLAEGGPVVVVDPGDSSLEGNALAGFLSEHNRTLDSLVFTYEPGDHPTAQRWPNAAVITPETYALMPAFPLPVAGWEALVLSPGRLGLYSKALGFLISGTLLRSAYIPALDAGADNYLQALEEVEKLDIKRVLPQVGPPAEGKREVRSRITAGRDYTQNLVRHVLTSMAANLQRERVLAVAHDIYEDYPFVDLHVANLESVWHEFERGGSR